MFLTTKEIVFFCLTFVIFFLISQGMKIKQINHYLASLIGAFVGTLVLILMYKLGKVSTNQRDSFNFEVSGPKKCQGYPYMLSSANPELQKYCKNLLSTHEGRKEYDRVNCGGKGYIGQPN